MCGNVFGSLVFTNLHSLPRFPTDVDSKRIFFPYTCHRKYLDGFPRFSVLLAIWRLGFQLPSSMTSHLYDYLEYHLFMFIFDVFLRRAIVSSVIISNLSRTIPRGSLSQREDVSGQSLTS